MPLTPSNPSRSRIPLTPVRILAYFLAIVVGLLAAGTQLVSYQWAQLIVLTQIVILLLCFLLCRRESLDDPERFSPTFIALIGLVLSFFAAPG